MKKSKADGGPAFPLVYETSDGYNGTIVHAVCGMTLRDYFAAKAMQALIAKAPFGVEDLVTDGEKQQRCADGAFAYAKAMLKAREE